jgi:hypothetical protein
MSRTGRHQFAADSVKLLLNSFGRRQSGGVRDRVQSAIKRHSIPALRRRSNVPSTFESGPQGFNSPRVSPVRCAQRWPVTPFLPA